MKSSFNYFINKAIKFGVVGTISTAVNYGSFAFLFKIVGLYYLFSSVTGYMIGVLVGYLLNKNWTFVQQVNKSKNYLMVYIIVYVVSLISSQLLLILLVEKIILDPLFANIYAIALSATMNFLGSNYFVFKKVNNLTTSNV